MRPIVIAIDPGKRKAGLAFGIDGILVGAQTVQADGPYQLAREIVVIIRERFYYSELQGPVTLVMEDPQDYPGKPRRVEDLDALRSMNDALVLELTPHVTPHLVKKWFSPGAWKGQLPKGPHHRRVRRALRGPERGLWRRLGHDARDAVGLFLFETGRLGRGGTRPR